MIALGSLVSSSLQVVTGVVSATTPRMIKSVHKKLLKGEESLEY